MRRFVPKISLKNENQILEGGAVCVCVDKMSSCTWLFCAAILLVVRLGDSLQPYLVDDIGGYGRRFDGIGGLSGGGVSHCQKYSIISDMLMCFVVSSIFQPSARVVIFICTAACVVVFICTG